MKAPIVTTKRPRMFIALLAQSGCWALVLLLSPAAWAQLNVPQLSPPSLPSLPTDPLTGALDNQVHHAVRSVGTELDSQGQRLARKARLAQLLQVNQALLETDANGALIMRHQVLVLSPTSATLQTAINAGFEVVEDQTLPGLDIRVVTLRTPQTMSTRHAITQLRALDPTGNYDFNHVYTQSAAEVSVAPDRNQPSPIKKASNNASSDLKRTALRVGLIDSGVDTHHSALRDNVVTSFGCEPSLPSEHGTAVASLLVGKNAVFAGAAPGAALYAADVYCGQAVGGLFTQIVMAMNWLVEQHVPVINVSLVGPDNALLKQAIHTLIARGHIVVAAVGNDGPAAPPLYPAAYPGVVGVTAVDLHDRVIVEAARGKQVMFAAPGAQMIAAVPHDQYATVRGTSFAAPIVAGLLAGTLLTPNVAQATQAILGLARTVGEAHDMDRTYGYGIVGTSVRITPAALQAHSSPAAHGALTH